jgi:hypothetical protein
MRQEAQVLNPLLNSTLNWSQIDDHYRPSSTGVTRDFASCRNQPRSQEKACSPPAETLRSGINASSSLKCLKASSTLAVVLYLWTLSSIISTSPFFKSSIKYGLTMRKIKLHASTRPADKESRSTFWRRAFCATLLA